MWYMLTRRCLHWLGNVLCTELWRISKDMWRYHNTNPPHFSLLQLWKCEWAYSTIVLWLSHIWLQALDAHCKKWNEESIRETVWKKSSNKNSERIQLQKTSQFSSMHTLQCTALWGRTSTTIPNLILKHMKAHTIVYRRTVIDDESVC